MEHEPAIPEKIRLHTEKLLRRADAIDRWPTPVQDILAASKLEEVPESPLAASVLGRAPEHLRHAVRLLKTGKVRAILDRRARVVHIDPAIDNEGRRHFVALHEVTHDLLPWQRELGYADNDMTLSDRARRTFEQEANQGAAEMFFQGARFTAIGANYEIGMEAVSALHEQSGASLRATLRRYAEPTGTRCARSRWSHRRARQSRSAIDGSRCLSPRHGLCALARRGRVGSPPTPSHSSSARATLSSATSSGQT